MSQPVYSLRDISGTALFAEMRARFAAWYRPGSGLPADFVDLSLSPDGRTVAAAAVLAEGLEGLPGQRLCLIDVSTGDIEFVSKSKRIDRGAKWSPDGSMLLFCSDRDAPYNFQLHLLSIADRSETCIPLENLWVEYAHWSPDGRRVLIAAAGRGVDLAGAQGGIPSPLAEESEAPAWAPAIEAGHDEGEWRSLWTYDLESRALGKVSPDGVTAWEAVWAGPENILFVASDRPGEEDWYKADLRMLDLRNGDLRTIYVPEDQLGWPSASPCGERIAIVEAVCSDRTIVAGTLLLGTPDGFSPVNTSGVDATFTAWQSETELLYAGHRSFETVLALHDTASKQSRLLWSNDQLTFGGLRYAEAAPGKVPGTAALMVEGFFRCPELVLIDDAGTRTVLSVGDPEFIRHCEALGEAHQHRWTAPDELEIHGWRLQPWTQQPNATVMDVHGGPVWMWRPRFIGRPSYGALLVERGFTLFQPNVRGASGRGQPYARMVFGDMGGADTCDFLSGIDQLVNQGIADPARLGITGGSYGGFMSAWLISQDRRFAAAAPIAPVTDWTSEHLTSHIGHFCELFLADDMTQPGGKYHSRSPIMFAAGVETPALIICGSIDQNTPPSQALEFHRALRRHGRESVLLTYPGEGHGVRKMPASIDFSSRLVGWFAERMPPNSW